MKRKLLVACLVVSLALSLTGSSEGSDCQRAPNPSCSNDCDYQRCEDADLCLVFNNYCFAGTISLCLYSCIVLHTCVCGDTITGTCHDIFDKCLDEVVNDYNSCLRFC